jgi:transposase
MAQTKEGQSSRSIHSLTPDALSSGQQAYKRRNLIERMFCKLKNWRRIMTAMRKTISLVSPSQP